MEKIEENLLKDVPDSSILVNIAKEIKNYKKINNKSPVIVMNSTFNENEIYALIIQSGGIVVFFEKSPSIEQFNEGNSTTDYKLFLESKNTKRFDSFLFYVQRNFSRQLTLSEFAKKVNAFAVLIKPKKDMLQYSGNLRYWFISHFNIENGTTIEFKLEHPRLSRDKMGNCDAMSLNILGGKPIPLIAVQIDKG